MAKYFNDGSANPPKLRVYLNLDNLKDLRADSIFSKGLNGRSRDERLAADGFEGIHQQPAVHRGSAR